MTAHALICRARADYGDLIVRIYQFDNDLGIDVHLIGGQIVQYFPSGQKHWIYQPLVRDRLMRVVSALRGRLRLLGGGHHC